jgi:hypothetical protein
MSAIDQAVLDRPAGVAMPLRVRAFNAKFSPNLGDGLLSECLEQALIEAGCDAERTYSVDLAARASYQPGSVSRGRLLAVLSATPTSVRRAVTGPPIAYQRAFKWAPHYRLNLEATDAVVIGGGNLFTDVDLNFPTKLASVFNAAASRHLPLAIYGVGVSSDWSARGLKIMRAALSRSRPRYVSVRDQSSKASFDRLFADAADCQARVVRDPGLMVSRFVPADRVDLDAIGLCITAAVAVRYHSSVLVSDDDLSDWYQALIGQIIDAGVPLRLFTNGSPEDIEFAAGLMQRLEPDHPSLVVERPTTPTELAQLVSGCGTVIAFRMHALIAAYSYGRNIVALRWDPKVDAFMASIGAGDRVIDAVTTPPSTLLRLAALAAPVGHQDVVAEASDSISPLVASLRSGQIGTIANA